MNTKDNIVFQNSMGVVSERRIILNRKSGAEEVVLGKISSISFKRENNLIVAIVSALIGAFLIGLLLMNFKRFSGTQVLVSLLGGLAMFLNAVANWIGNYRISLGVGGSSPIKIRVPMYKKNEAVEFFKAVNKVLP